MIPRPALWAPATTPVDADETRRYLRARPFALALLALAGLSIVLWLFTGSGAQLVIGIAVGAVVVLDAVTSRRAIRTADVELLVSPMVTTADPLVCTIRVVGVSRPVTLSPAARPNVQRFLISDGTPGMIVLAPRRRGIVHTLVFDLALTGPVGLVVCARRFRVAVPLSVLVAPTPLPHDVEWPVPRAVDFGLSESAPVGDELYRTVRPYVRGDSRRRVHWKASAHRGSLMVKESDGTGVASVQVVVQLDGPGAAAEVALGRAAWIVRESLARGWRTDLVTVQPRGVPSAPPVGLGSPFGAPPLDSAPTMGTTHVVRQRVTNERAALMALALAGYGSIEVSARRGATCLVSPGGDRWV